MNLEPADLSERTGAPPARRWWGWLVLIVAGVLAIWYACDNAGRWKDRFVPRKLRTIESGRIYASGQIDRRLIRQVLDDDHIKVIVCLVADDSADPDVAAELDAARELRIERFVDPLGGDGTGDFHAYADAVTQMAAARKNGEPVLVHCSSGAQRSNGATYFYRVLIERWNADSAEQEMLRNGHDPRSNPALIPYLNLHIGDVAAILKDKGVIDHIPDPLPQIRHE
jgi:protein tyrosine/serine phosphatase